MRSICPAGASARGAGTRQPTQPVATRPLGIRKDGTWYTYGWDLTKNICEVFSSGGTILTAYTYTPYGSVTANGNVSQPIQWSSEYNDTELGLVYYNYRHYNPEDGRWTGRDVIDYNTNNIYAYANNEPFVWGDFIGSELYDTRREAIEAAAALVNSCTRELYEKQMQRYEQATRKPDKKPRQVEFGVCVCYDEITHKYHVGNPGQGDVGAIHPAAIPACRNNHKVAAIVHSHGDGMWKLSSSDIKLAKRGYGSRKKMRSNSLIIPPNTIVASTAEVRGQMGIDVYFPLRALHAPTRTRIHHEQYWNNEWRYANGEKIK